ncbi:MAG: hypothetical protein U0797_30595 [Gemmataceae bacterium]
MPAAQAVRAGDAELVAAGGMESMSRAPHLLFGTRRLQFGDQKAVDAMVHDGLWCAFEGWPMGEAAGAHRRLRRELAPTRTPTPPAASTAAGAWEQGLFDAEVVPGVGSKREGEAGDARRGLAARDDGGGAGEAAPVVPRGRHGDGRQRLDAVDVMPPPSSSVLEGRGSRLGTQPLACVVAYATMGWASKEIFIALVAFVRRAGEGEPR